MTDAATVNRAVPLLTIIVPTYNRADNLALLLRTLKAETAGLGEAVTVLVSDNASTDRTPEVTREIQEGWPALVVQQHAQNLGPEVNFCTCVERVESRYFWIIGDDDLPKSGAIKHLEALLRTESPDLVYIESEWVKEIIGSTQGQPIAALHVESMDLTAFARAVNVWFTFISGVIVNRQMLERLGALASIRRFSGSSLVQLGWIFPLLRTGGRFFYLHGQCVLATAGNTGGYAVFTVFGANFAHIAREVLGPDSAVAALMIRRSLIGYLPDLIWSVRFSNIGTFEPENAWGALRLELGQYFAYWVLIVPLANFPKWLAWPFLKAAHIASRSIRLRDRFLRPST